MCVCGCSKRLSEKAAVGNYIYYCSLSPRYALGIENQGVLRQNIG